MRRPKLNDWIQGFIAVVLVCNLVYFWVQVQLTKTLNQPICGVKHIEPQVTPVPSGKKKVNVVSFSAVLVNSGNYAATDTTISWKQSTVQNGAKYTIKPLGTEPDRRFVFLPKQELKWLLFHEQTEKTNKRILGYEKYDEIEIVIDYRDMRNELRRYSCVYRIMRLMSGQLDYYESFLWSSKNHERSQSMLWKWLLGIGLGVSFTGLIVMVHARRYRTPDGKTWDCVHGNIHPKLNYFGWFLTGAGFVLQIIGIMGT